MIECSPQIVGGHGAQTQRGRDGQQALDAGELPSSRLSDGHVDALTGSVGQMIFEQSIESFTKSADIALSSFWADVD